MAVLDEGGYELVRRDTSRNEHEVTTATGTNDIARNLTIWMAARNFPGLPTRQVADFYQDDMMKRRARPEAVVQ